MKNAPDSDVRGISVAKQHEAVGIRNEKSSQHDFQLQCVKNTTLVL